jgi:hypothetical protein
MDHADPELAHYLKSLYDPIQSTYSKVRLLIIQWNLFIQKRLQDPGIGFDAFNRGRIDAALVDGDFLRHIV